MLYILWRAYEFDGKNVNLFWLPIDDATAKRILMQRELLYMKYVFSPSYSDHVRNVISFFIRVQRESIMFSTLRDIIEKLADASKAKSVLLFVYHPVKKNFNFKSVPLPTLSPTFYS